MYIYIDHHYVTKKTAISTILVGEMPSFPYGLAGYLITCHFSMRIPSESHDNPTRWGPIVAKLVYNYNNNSE